MRKDNCTTCSRMKKAFEPGMIEGKEYGVCSMYGPVEKVKKGRLTFIRIVEYEHLVSEYGCSGFQEESLNG